MVLADDYRDLLGAFERLLTPSCDIVGSVSHGDALLAVLASVKPDVIVLDVFMPPTNGFDLCREIKQRAPSTIVIMVSAASDLEIRDEALRAGAFAFITKGAAVDTLWPAIKRAMGKAPGPSGS